MKTERKATLSIVLMTLFMFMNLCRNFLWLIPSSLMEPIMEDMNLNYIQAGQLLMIVTAFMGVFLFFGSYLLNRIAPIASMMIGLCALAVDGCCSFFAVSFPVMLAGRVFAGVGYGLTTCSTSTLIASWFEKERLGFANGINNCMSSLSITAAYAGIVPIYNFLGQSWRKETMLMGCFSIVTLVLFAIWFVAGRKYLKQTVGQSARQNTVRAALAFPIVRRLTGIMSCTMLVYVCINSYYPNYLNQELGFTLERASSIVGAMSISGMTGSLLTGSFLHLFSNKKPLLLGFFLLIVLGFLSAMTLHHHIFLTGAIACFGFGFASMNTLGATMIMSQREISPVVAGAGSALMCAFGSLLGIFVPNIQQALAVWRDLRWSLLAFGVLLLPALVLILTMPKGYVKGYEG